MGARGGFSKHSSEAPAERFEHPPRAPYHLSNRRKNPRPALVFRELGCPRNQALELIQHQVGDRLQQLLIGPADLTGLLVEVERGVAVGLEGAVEILEQ